MHVQRLVVEGCGETSNPDSSEAETADGSADSARTVTVQLPHSACTVPIRKNCSARTSFYSKVKVTLHQLLHMLKIWALQFFPTGTVRALCGNCTVTVRALSSPATARQRRTNPLRVVPQPTAEFFETYPWDVKGPGLK